LSRESTKRPVASLYDLQGSYHPARSTKHSILKCLNIVLGGWIAGIVGETHATYPYLHHMRINKFCIARLDPSMLFSNKEKGEKICQKNQFYYAALFVHGWAQLG
jgi:hypothetical protein